MVTSPEDDVMTPRPRRQSGDTIYSDNLLDLLDAEEAFLLDDDCALSPTSCASALHHYPHHHHYPHRRSVKISHHIPSNASPWRRKLGTLMESRPVEICIVILVIIDVVCVTAEVLHYLDVLVDTENVRHGCHIMGIISLAVLGIFTFEIVLKMVAFGKHFWSHFWHVFDLFVVVVAITVETIEHFMLSKHRIERGGQDGSSVPGWLYIISGAVIFARLIRVFQGAKEIYEYTIKKGEKKHKKEIKSVIEAKDSTIEKLQEEILLMRKRNNLRRLTLERRATQSECGFDIRSTPGDYRRGTQGEVGGFFGASPSSSRRRDTQSDFGGYYRSNSRMSGDRKSLSSTTTSEHFNQSFNSSNITRSNITRSNIAKLNSRYNSRDCDSDLRTPVKNRTQDTVFTSPTEEDFISGGAQAEPLNLNLMIGRRRSSEETNT